MYIQFVVKYSFPHLFSDTPARDGYQTRSPSHQLHPQLCLQASQQTQVEALQAGWKVEAALGGVGGPKKALRVSCF